MSPTCTIVPAALAALLLSSVAAAQTNFVATPSVRSDAASPASDQGPDVIKPAVPAPEPERYVGAFLMRGVKPGNGARFDMTNAPFLKDGSSGLVTTMMLSGSYKVTDGFGLSVKLGIDRVGLGGADTKVGFVNPSIGAMYGWKIGRWFRIAPSLSVSIPVGTGGGNSGDPDLVAAHKLAALARCAQENAMFGVNDMTVGYGLDFAYIAYGFTAQVGAGLSTGFRVRGEQVQSDTYKVNSTYGLGLGYFVHPQLSIGAELRYQTRVSPLRGHVYRGVPRRLLGRPGIVQVLERTGRIKNVHLS
jgi:hypothetical protein